MSYECCGGGCSGYSSSSGGYASQNQEVSSNYSSQASSAKPARMIGCTCGGVTACRGTCRTPMPE